MAGEDIQEHILLVGSNYRLAKVEILEALVRRVAVLQKDFTTLQPEVSELIALCTCNRAEIYAVSNSPSAALHKISKFLSDDQEVQSHLYSLLDEEAAEHLFSVSSGIDSMVIGEGQILQQVREVLRQASTNGSAGPILKRLFQRALSVGRKVRSEIRLGSSSLGRVILKLLQSEFPDRTPRVLLVGSGKIGTDIAQHIATKNGRVIVASRSPQRVSSLLGPLVEKTVSLGEIPELLSSVDVLVCATVSDGFLISIEQVKKAIADNNRTLLLVDVAVPRNIDPAVKGIEGVDLKSIDDLVPLIETSAEELQPELSKAQKIIREESDQFIRHLKSASVESTIRDLRQFAESVRCEELEEAMKRLSSLSASERESIASLSKSIVNRILHTPTERLRELAGEEAEISEYLGLLADLFDINPSEARDQIMAPKKLQTVSRTL